MKFRQIAKSFLAIEQSEGHGARVRRSIGNHAVRNLSPFLMLDHLTSGNGGFPDHPHRGQETITYVIKGRVDHEDFTGSKGSLMPGDLQFMTAGRGIVHAEMGKKDEDGSDPEMLQLWVDLPKNLKECEPRYRDLRANEIPIAKPNDEVTVKVISGKSYGIESRKDLAYTPVWFLDFTVQPGGKVEQELPQGWNAFLYLAKGTLNINDQKIERFHNTIFDREGDGIQVSVSEDATEPAQFLVIAGQVLDQPIVQHGPFVETSRERIYKAFMDFQDNANGFERAKNWQSGIGQKFYANGGVYD